MKRFYHISFLVIVFALTIESCTYDYLTIKDCDGNEFDALVGDTMGKMPGTWEWIYSRGPCGTKYPGFCYSSPQTEGYTLSLMFREDGKYKEYRNDSLVKYGGVTFTINTPSPYPDQSQFWIHLINCMSEDVTVGQFYVMDTLLLGHYPFEYGGSNLFVRK